MPLSSIMAIMNRLSIADRTRIVSSLVEGNSIRSTCRITGAAKGTVLKLVSELGEVCAAYHDEHVRGMSTRRIQCDRDLVVLLCQRRTYRTKEGRRCRQHLDLDRIRRRYKANGSYMCGTRDALTAILFIKDLASRLSNRVQLTTDGHRAYLDAVEAVLGDDVDYAMLIKLYGHAKDERRYSPGEVIGIETIVRSGRPDPRYISTSYVERQNLTMRMSMRRFTRLTNGFSKKIENHEAAIALHFMYYNFCRVHRRCASRLQWKPG